MHLDIRTQQRNTRTVIQGLVYEHNHLTTGWGLLDVHVLLADVNDPCITIAPLKAGGALGRSDTVPNMVAHAGAAAGINADYFASFDEHTTHFGPMVQDGRLLAANATVNVGACDFGTFCLDRDNRMTFVFTHIGIPLFVNGQRSPVSVDLYNTVGQQLGGVLLIDRFGMEDTAMLQQRMPAVQSIVISGGIVTQIADRGVAVAVPQDGFVLMLPEEKSDQLRYFAPGDRVEKQIINAADIDFTRVQAAIGGGKLILQGGTLPPNGVVNDGRHPRSALGATADGKLVMMAVDGRSRSVGVTYEELAALMQHYGAVDAIHLDGGGSTTLAVQDQSGVPVVVNTPSDGSPRRVINALGVSRTKISA